MTLRYPNKGFKLCPHCNGETTCDCATCGDEPLHTIHRTSLDAGVCQVCHGHGQVRDPDYKPSVETNSHSGCMVAGIALLLPLLIVLMSATYCYAFAQR